MGLIRQGKLNQLLFNLIVGWNICKKENTFKIQDIEISISNLENEMNWWKIHEIAPWLFEGNIIREHNSCWRSQGSNRIFTSNMNPQFLNNAILSSKEILFSSSLWGMAVKFTWIQICFREYRDIFKISIHVVPRRKKRTKGGFGTMYDFCD